MKKVIVTVTVILSVLIVAELTGSFFLMRFAIARKDADFPEPIYEVRDDVRERVYRNTGDIAAKTADWLRTLDIEQVSITAPDGILLCADCVDNGGTDWVILLHGYSRTRAKVYNYGRAYAEHGYSLLMPDMRGHGSSGGDYMGMGIPDRKDVPGWAEMIRSRRPDARIVIHGVSMGAASAMTAAAEALPGNVRAVVEDCGYTSALDIFGDVMRELAHLPEFPLLYTASAEAKLFAGYSFGEVTPLDCVKRSNVPIMFIHGSADGFVHTDMVYRLYEACTTEKALLIAEGAAHGQAMYIDPEGYFGRVFEFVDRYVRDSGGDGNDDGG